MYKIEETFNNMLDDFLIAMVGAAVALDGSGASSEPMLRRAAPPITRDAAVSARHLDIGMRPADAKTSEETAGRTWKSIVPGTQQKTGVWKGAKQVADACYAAVVTDIRITASRIPVPPEEHQTGEWYLKEHTLCLA